MRYRNILLDMGHVLVDYDAYLSISRFTDSPEIGREVYLIVFRSSEWTMLDAGLISEEEALETMHRRCSSEKVWEAARESFLHWHEYNMIPIPHMDEVVRDLKKAGHRVYVLSNASIRLPDHDNWKNILPVPDLYDGVFFSASYGYIKPQRRIYELFLDRFQLKAEDCYFVDDLERNIAAGRECGIEGYRFDGNISRLREVLGI